LGNQNNTLLNKNKLIQTRLNLKLSLIKNKKNYKSESTLSSRKIRNILLTHYLMSIQKRYYYLNNIFMKGGENELND